ncbi:MAG: helix-turn-helix domain-containing protein [Pseudomonadales bacterium]|jgi:transcriptional regulator with XRE-family HTH domain|nr:helix-turn-helix domain-containing protein [Pseudomonadales bacterium]
MHTEALVQLALDILSCSQKELADRLKVSPTQISKWKKGEHMSHDMETKLRKLANIGDRDPQFVVWAGSIDDADKWDKLIHYLASQAMEDAETGYDTDPLRDEIGLLSWQTFHTMTQMGVAIPKGFPKELDIDYDHDSDESDIESAWELIEGNPHAWLIFEMFKSLNDVYGFYAAYVNELVFDDELDLMNTPACNIEACLLELAASKLEEPRIATRFREFKRHTNKDYEEWLGIVKDRAFRAGVPLRAELLELVHESAGALGHSAEAESQGINAARLHPDVYMNELLCGMRVIHQVLPAILKKLGIDEEFKLNESELWIR